MSAWEGVALCLQSVYSYLVRVLQTGQRTEEDIWTYSGTSYSSRSSSDPVDLYVTLLSIRRTRTRRVTEYNWYLHVALSCVRRANFSVLRLANLALWEADIWTLRRSRI